MDHVFWCNGYHLILKNIVKGQGCYLYDNSGMKYLDLESGVWCTPLGHSHPKLNQVLNKQVENIIHTGYCYANPVTEEAARAILDIVGMTGGKCVFLNSGSEAVEFGVRVIRKVNPKPKLLSLVDSFLGSYGTAGKKKQAEWYLLDWSQCRYCPGQYKCNNNCTVFANIPFDQIGGFIFEPGSSSGFVRFPPKKFILNLVKKIKEDEGLIQINEVTTGIGRTGKWFGFQHYDLQPDIVSMGKGLGNGYPVSAIALNSELIKRLLKTSFYYSQSHQNDALGCAIARGVIHIMNEEKTIEQCKKIGEYFISRLKEFAEKYDIIKEVRGRGLMLAVEFNDRYKKMSQNLYKELLKRGYITAYGSSFLRIDPPLIIKEDDINRFLDTLENILTNLTTNNII